MRCGVMHGAVRAVAAQGRSEPIRGEGGTGQKKTVKCKKRVGGSRNVGICDAARCRAALSGKGWFRAGQRRWCCAGRRLGHGPGWTRAWQSLAPRTPGRLCPALSTRRYGHRPPRAASSVTQPPPTARRQPPRRPPAEPGHIGTATQHRPVATLRPSPAESEPRRYDAHSARQSSERRQTGHGSRTWVDWAAVTGVTLNWAEARARVKPVERYLR